MIRNNRKFAINKFAINVEKMYRLCTFLAGELQKLRNKRKFAISVFIISEFYCIAKKVTIIHNIFYELIIAPFDKIPIDPSQNREESQFQLQRFADWRCMEKLVMKCASLKANFTPYPEAVYTQCAFCAPIKCEINNYSIKVMQWSYGKTFVFI